ncbi:MAG: FAD-dependent oxidoreductase, partial [Candidatus Omnitrophica bacterium]|nr:FAD-dependent oxidoreductase [Candidatus Omnitrophota bacterium]
MNKQSPEERIRNFKEVAFGLSEEEALKEASRCLLCKKAKCSMNCPVEIDIPAFIDALKKKEFDRAIKIIKEKNKLPGVCGRVCPQENQCEGACVLNAKKAPINIGSLERFAADYEFKNKPSAFSPQYSAAKQIKAAIIGSGPAGLTCAGDLARMGYQVTVFEALHIAGGVLMYGIPEFRLPKEIVKKEVAYLVSLGVEVKTNFIVGKTSLLKDIFEQGYKAVFAGTGAGLPSFMNIPGENLNRVYSSNELLTRVNLMKAYLFPEYDTPI